MAKKSARNAHGKYSVTAAFSGQQTVNSHKLPEISPLLIVFQQFIHSWGCVIYPRICQFSFLFTIDSWHSRVFVVALWKYHWFIDLFQLLSTYMAKGYNKLRFSARIFYRILFGAQQKYIAPHRKDPAALPVSGKCFSAPQQRPRASPWSARRGIGFHPIIVCPGSPEVKNNNQ